MIFPASTFDDFHHPDAVYDEVTKKKKKVTLNSPALLHQDVPGPKLSGQGQGPSEASRAPDAELRLLCQRLGCKTCDGMMVFSL